MIITGYVRDKREKPEVKVVYKYIPRTFDESQDNPPSLMSVFGKMFNESSPWIGSLGNNIERKKKGDKESLMFCKNCKKCMSRGYGWDFCKNVCVQCEDIDKLPSLIANKVVKLQNKNINKYNISQ